jgi:hypothetical protein
MQLGGGLCGNERQISTSKRQPVAANTVDVQLATAAG